MAQAVPATAAALGGRRRTRQRLLGYAFLAPAVAVHLFVVGLPALAALGLSLTDWDGLRIPRFIGLANFEELIQRDGVFWQAFLNNLRWMAVFLTIPVALGLGTAVMLSRVTRLQTFYRVVFFLPYVFASVVVSRIFGFIYNPFYGVNKLFRDWGLDVLAQSWLGDPGIALYSVMAADVWHFWGFDMVVFLAALQQIDPSLYEAATIDGAGGWQRFRYMTLPLLRPTFGFILMMTALWSFLSFDYVYVMTGGGPAHATELMATWIIGTAVETRRAGYASALAVTLTLLSSVIIAGFLYLRRRGVEV
jgi:raffinose/stachyose/melibiose transport system permease protein